MDTVPFQLASQAIATAWHATAVHDAAAIDARRFHAPCHASKAPSTAEMLANPRRVLISAKFRASHHGWPAPEEINVLRLAREDLVFALSCPGPPAPDEGRK